MVSGNRGTVDSIRLLLYSCIHPFCRSLPCVSNSVSPRQTCQLVQLKPSCFPMYRLPTSANRKQKNCFQLSFACKHDGESNCKNKCQSGIYGTISHGEDLLSTLEQPRVMAEPCLLPGLVLLCRITLVASLCHRSLCAPY